MLALHTPAILRLVAIFQKVLNAVLWIRNRWIAADISMPEFFFTDRVKHHLFVENYLRFDVEYGILDVWPSVNCSIRELCYDFLHTFKHFGRIKLFAQFSHVNRELDSMSLASRDNFLRIPAELSSFSENFPNNADKLPKKRQNSI